MIDVKELMIGNWLLGCNKKYFQVDANTFEMLEHKEIEGYSDCPTAIPLTLKVLSDSGFLELNIMGLYYVHPSIKEEEFTIFNPFSTNEIYLHSPYRSREIKYVHELQNLFYILTNTSLQIKI